jgi:hypothetical protein
MMRWLGPRLVWIHRRYCRPALVRPVLVLAWVCWLLAAALLAVR